MYTKYILISIMSLNHCLYQKTKKTKFLHKPRNRKKKVMSLLTKLSYKKKSKIYIFLNINSKTRPYLVL